MASQRSPDFLLRTGLLRSSLRLSAQPVSRDPCSPSAIIRVSRLAGDITRTPSTLMGRGKLSTTFSRVVRFFAVRRANSSRLGGSAVVDGESGSYVIEVDSANVCHRHPIAIRVRSGDMVGVTKSDGGRFTAQNVIVNNAKEFKEGQILSAD